ncbi:hypothetical protein PMAYCL1PPCAC_04956, partial [Pristionchus mayeri]
TDFFRTLAMIGMINLPTDGPMEFYASRVAKNTDPTSRVPTLSRPSTLANLSELHSISYNSKPLPSPATREKIRFSLGLFSHRQRQPSQSYCADGRKCQDARPVSARTPSKLWEELFMRKMVNRIQGEIAIPLEHLQTMEKTFGRMNLRSRRTSRSEPNLCSEDKEKEVQLCDACSAAIDEELGVDLKRERASSDVGVEKADSESALQDIMDDLLTPSMSSAPGSTQNLCSD